MLQFTWILVNSLPEVTVFAFRFAPESIFLTIYESLGSERKEPGKAMFIVKGVLLQQQQK